MSRTPARVVALLGVAALALTGCGSRPTTAGPNRSAQPTYTACMVLDVGGVDDRSFNQSAWEGVRAAETLNSAVRGSYVSSSSQNDYVPNLNAQVAKGCSTTIAVGGLMSDAVKQVAGQHPQAQFAQIDAPSSRANVYGLQYNTAQGAFLGGYLAAGMTKTGKVATFGGVNIPSVTVYMDGFWEGVRYYNAHNAKAVQVLGWDEKNRQGGTFTGSFTDQGKGRATTEAFVQAGADIVFPVAGQTGLGAGAAAAAAGGRVNLLWVDTDGCVSAPQYCKFFVSSVTKNITDSVKRYITQSASGSVPTGSYIGNLANNGTGLAPYHGFTAAVPGILKSGIQQVRRDIIAGRIEITSPSQPR